MQLLLSSTLHAIFNSWLQSSLIPNNIISSSSSVHVLSSSLPTLWWIVLSLSLSLPHLPSIPKHLLPAFQSSKQTPSFNHPHPLVVLFQCTPLPRIVKFHFFRFPNARSLTTIVASPVTLPVTSPANKSSISSNIFFDKYSFAVLCDTTTAPITEPILSPGQRFWNKTCSTFPLSIFKFSTGLPN